MGGCSGAAAPTESCLRLRQALLVFGPECDAPQVQSVRVSNVTDRECPLSARFSASVLLGGLPVFELVAPPARVPPRQDVQLQVGRRPLPGSWRAVIAVDDGDPNSPEQELQVDSIVFGQRQLELLVPSGIRSGQPNRCGPWSQGPCQAYFPRAIPGTTSRALIQLTTRSCTPITVESLHLTEGSGPDGGLDMSLVSAPALPFTVAADAGASLLLELAPRLENSVPGASGRRGILEVVSDGLDAAGMPLRTTRVVLVGDVPVPNFNVTPQSCDYEEPSQRCGCPSSDGGLERGVGCVTITNGDRGPAVLVDAGCYVDGDSGTFSAGPCVKLTDTGSVPLDGPLAEGEQLQCRVSYQPRAGRVRERLVCPFVGAEAQSTLYGNRQPCFSALPSRAVINPACGVNRVSVRLVNAWELRDGGPVCTGCGPLDILDAGITASGFWLRNPEQLIRRLEPCQSVWADIAWDGGTFGALALQTNEASFFRFSDFARVELFQVAPPPATVFPRCTVCTPDQLRGDPACQFGGTSPFVSASAETEVWVSCARSEVTGETCGRGTRPAKCRLGITRWRGDGGDQARLLGRDGGDCQGGVNGWAPYADAEGAVHMCKLAVGPPGASVTLGVAAALEDGGSEGTALMACGLIFTP